MGDSGLNVFFENFLKKESLFLEKKVLQNSFIPEKLPHREEQINQLAHILAPALKQERPSNVFIYGMTGTGKTVTVRYTTQELHKVATGRNIPLEIIYINCKINRTADTEYRLIAELSISLGRMVPPTGLPTSRPRSRTRERTSSSSWTKSTTSSPRQGITPSTTCCASTMRT